MIHQLTHPLSQNMIYGMSQTAKRIPVPITDRLQSGLARPEALGFSARASQAQMLVDLAEEGLEHRETRLRLEARRARYAAWAADADEAATSRAEADLALSEKAI